MRTRRHQTHRRRQPFPFQLPDCLQFVYADFSETDLERLPVMSAKNTDAAAYARTSRVIHDLLPTHFANSPEVSRMLRVAMHDETHHWLPSADREPRVSPLNTGAGQLPTVGRAALFATLRSGLEPVLRPLREAIDAIGGSAGELAEMRGGQGGHITGCDVFVAFSVAGGTGAGIYYDFIHLIAQEFQQRVNLPGLKIYPLVIMPSAFPPQAGGGREAELNSARALVDLSRLVDDQNVPKVSADFGEDQQVGAGVRYPGHGLVQMRSSTVQTAILLGLTAGLQPEDLRRSITAMVMSLMAAELGDERPQGRTEGDYQSFAASFVNKSVERSKPAKSGIGHRGLSTSLAASLTVPVDDLAELVAGRLLAQAIMVMDEDALRAGDNGKARVIETFERSGIVRLWNREAPEVPTPDPLPKGTALIRQALRDRIGDMTAYLGRLERQLDQKIAELVDGFKPDIAVCELLAHVSPFQLEKILGGLPGHPQREAEAGFVGMLENRKNDPEQPEGIGMTAPRIPAIRRRAGGLVPARWGDPDVQYALDEQDEWYRWRANRLWHEGWRGPERRWRPPLLRGTKEVADLVAALRAHREAEDDQFKDRRKELYREDRKGVKYLLPPASSLRGFYDDVFRRLSQHENLPDNPGADTLLAKLIRPEHWTRALKAAHRSPRAAVTVLKQVLESRVKELFGQVGVVNDRPLLPPLGELLKAAASGEEAQSAVDRRLLDQFRSQLKALLPVGFVPDGSGPLKVLIVHPRSEADPAVARYLGEQLNLPRELDVTTEYQPVDTEAITVVLFRSGMSLTDISEVRHVLTLWSKARDDDGEEDFLHWRQRLGYRDDWLASTESDRRGILHRILCAVWNGDVDVFGDAASPEAIRIRLGEGNAATIGLRLEAFDYGVSSWAGLLRAYERWALVGSGGSGIIEDVCTRLMRTQPRGLSGMSEPPSPLFTQLVHEVAPGQLAQLKQLEWEFEGEDKEWLVPLRDFWQQTFQGALDLRFPGAARRARSSLRALEDRHADGGTNPAGGTGHGGGPGAAPDKSQEQVPPAPRRNNGHRPPAVGGKRPSTPSVGEEEPGWVSERRPEEAAVEPFSSRKPSFEKPRHEGRSAERPSFEKPSEDDSWAEDGTDGPRNEGDKRDWGDWSDDSGNGAEGSGQ